MLSTGAVLLLVLIAVASVLQTVCLALLARHGLKMQKEMEGLGRQLTRDLQPLIEDLSRISRNAAEVSDRGVVQARRLDEALGDAARTIEHLVATTSQVVMPVAGRVAAVAAGLRMFSGGRRLLRRLIR